MRVNRQKAEENRANVIKTAGRLFRENGFDGIGVAGLMKGAGLTRGGFYKQFESKEDLAVQATDAALASSNRKWRRVIEAGAEDPLAALARFYLSPEHRDSPGAGCSLAALGSEISRHGPALRAAFESGLRDHIAQVEPLEGSVDAAIATLSTMVGALILSRAVADPDLSDRILEAATRSIVSPEPE